MSKTITEHQEWLNERKTYLGGTDVAAIVGENQFKSPLQVWYDKKGLSDDFDNPKMRMGREREPFVVDRYVEKTGEAVVETGTVVHPTIGFFAANPDRLLVNRPGILECKTGINRHRGTFGWGEPGTDQVPRTYLIQCVWYLGICNRDFCDLAFEDRETCETNIYRVFRDMEYENLLFEVAQTWWEKFIVGDTEPPADERDLEAIKNALPRDNGEIISATEQVEAMVYETSKLKAKASPLYKQASDLEAQIKQFMGEASTLTLLGDEKVTWKNNASKPETDWETVAKTLGATPELIESCTTVKPGARVFRLPKLN